MNKISLSSILFISLSYTCLAATTSLPPSLSTHATNVRPIPSIHTQHSEETDDSDYHDFGDDTNLNTPYPTITPLPKKQKKCASKKTKKNKRKTKKTKQQTFTEKEINDVIAEIQYIFLKRTKIVKKIIKGQGGKFELADNFYEEPVAAYVKEYANRDGKKYPSKTLSHRVKNAIRCCNKVLWEYWELVFREINIKENPVQRKMSIITALLRKNKVKVSRKSSRVPPGRLVSTRVPQHVSFMRSLGKIFPEKEEVIKKLWREYLDTNDAISEKAKKEQKKVSTKGVKDEKISALTDFIDQLGTLYGLKNNCSDNKNKKATQPTSQANSIADLSSDEDEDDKDIALPATSAKQKKRGRASAAETTEDDASTAQTNQPARKKRRLICNDSSHPSNEIPTPSQNSLSDPPPTVDLIDIFPYKGKKLSVVLGIYKDFMELNIEPSSPRGERSIPVLLTTIFSTLSQPDPSPHNPIQETGQVLNSLLLDDVFFQRLINFSTSRGQAIREAADLYQKRQEFNWKWKKMLEKTKMLEKAKMLEKTKKNVVNLFEDLVDILADNNHSRDKKVAHTHTQQENTPINYVSHQEPAQRDMLHAVKKENSELQNYSHYLAQYEQYDYLAKSQTEPTTHTNQILTPMSFSVMHQQNTPINYLCTKEEEQRYPASLFTKQNNELYNSYHPLNNNMLPFVQYSTPTQTSDYFATVNGKEFTPLL